jgi:hypothetical protein
MPMTRPTRRQRFLSLSIPLLSWLVGAVAVCGPVDLTAQNSALASVSALAPVIEYAANESGGRIRVSSPTADSASIEATRALLFENAAAFRRGDLKALRIVRTDLPALHVLAERRETIRCTVRVTPRGGELVLLSDDSDVVEAIHQILTGPPPRTASF